MASSKHDKLCIKRLKSGGIERHNQIKELMKEHAGLKHIHLNAGELSEQDREEKFNETFFVFDKMVQEDRFQGDSAIKTILYAIFSNLCTDVIRKATTIKRIAPDKLVYEVEDHIQSGLPKIMMIYAEEEDKERAKKFMKMAGEDCKKLLYMAYYEDFDNEEIALRMKYKNGGVVRNKKYECLKKIREMVAKNRKVA